MIYVITLCYNTEPMMRASLKRFEETFGIPRNRFKHVFLNQHYPRYQNETKALIQELETLENTLVLDDGKNLGLAAGWNYCLSKIDLKPDDIVFAFDPDCFPAVNGWGYAMERVMKDDNFWWLTCWTPHTERETSERGFVDLEVNGVRVRRTKAACLNSVSCFKGQFLLASAGMHEQNKWYGGFEVSMFPRLVKYGKHWGFLKDFHEEHAPDGLIDIDYREWKWVTTHGSERGKQIEYGEWLKKNGKI